MIKNAIYGAICLAGIAGLPVFAAHAQETRNDLAACAPGHPSILAHVHGFKSNVGVVRAQAYHATAEEFLESGKWLRRIEVVRTSDDLMTLCIPLPAPGTYAIAIRHDANNNDKSDWNDGGGFSRNPKLSLFKLKPSHSNVAVTVDNNPLKLDIVMQYRKGLSLGPL